ncbi:PDDEXK nuclease domain-containing protein [Arthrobacter sp. LAPM80]|uniref:PDDEXK nuclease domain-containing protein n=1 Tax=Arthrobacter sp. LAPM80 TaxID=3141788 RepID=UPI00398B2D42
MFKKYPYRTSVTDGTVVECPSPAVYKELRSVVAEVLRLVVYDVTRIHTTYPDRLYPKAVFATLQGGCRPDLEQALMDRIVGTLRELGLGFTFVGWQVHFDVGGDDFYSVLLFFHVEQLRYIVIELRTGKFQPEHAGQLNFYVTLVDDRLRREAHADTVGILICGDKNDHTVRYSLGRVVSPLVVASYTYDSLPATERAGLPDVEKLTAALDWPSEETIPSAPE